MIRGVGDGDMIRGVRDGDAKRQNVDARTFWPEGRCWNVLSHRFHVDRLDGCIDPTVTNDSAGCV